MRIVKAVKYKARSFANDGIVVVAHDTGKATVLSPNEMRVLELLDGTRDTSQVRSACSDLDEAVVNAAFEKLQSSKLIPETRMPLKAADLLEESIGDELVIYSSRDKRAYCLNKTSAFVFAKCDGVTLIDDVVDALQAMFGCANGFEMLMSAMNELRSQGIIPTETILPEGPSRRDFLKLAAGVGVMVPALTALALPSPAQALSCVTASACTHNKVGLCGHPCGNCPSATEVCTRYSIQINNNIVELIGGGGCINPSVGGFSATVQQDCKFGCGQAGVFQYHCCTNGFNQLIPVGGTGCSYCGSGHPSPNLCQQTANSHITCKGNTCQQTG